MDLRTPENVMKGAEGFYLKGNERGVFLIHGGGGGTAADMREIGNYIHEESGYSVFAPLLPGYGTTKEDLKTIHVDDWINALKQWFREFKNEVDEVFVIGHSMGGVQALIITSEFPEEVSGVVSISTPIKLKGFLLKLVPFFKLFITYWKVNDLEKFARIYDGKWVGYERIPLNLVSKFKKLMRIMLDNLDKVKAPILIIQGNRDQYINEKSAIKIYNEVNSETKDIVWLNCNHEILFSDVKKELFSKIINFLKKN
ncbi:MAG: alpha/beta fold hydrolase [Candidatus Lokiarchaeota archaeon]|nr:alpha/beta fold hydrolase [Candidatus Lokiarchaeota archaeon]